MKILSKLIAMVALLGVAVACDEPAEEVVQPETNVSVELGEVGLTDVEFTVTLKNVDRAFYFMANNIQNPTEEEILAKGKAIEFDAEASYTDEQRVTITVDKLDMLSSYRVCVVATNKDWSSMSHTDIFKTDGPRIGKIATTDIQIESAKFDVVAYNVHSLSYGVMPLAYFEENGGELGEFFFRTGFEFTPIDLGENTSFEENGQRVSLEATGLTAATEYKIIVLGDNRECDMDPVDASESHTFTTLEIEVPEVQMSDIEVLDVVGHTAEFSVTTRYMDDFGFVVVPTAEYTEMTVEDVLANSLQYYWADGNLSWDEDFTFPFNADTQAETDYTVVAVATNSSSSVMKTATFTTPKEEMTVEMRSISFTSGSVESNGSDHFLTLRTALYELRVHLVSDTFGGHYEPTSTTHYFVAEGSYFKELNIDDTWTVYDDVDPTFGNIDLYENVISNRWEIYGSFLFLPSLTLQIEVPEGITIDGAERNTPVEFNLNIKSASAVRDSSNGSLWNLTLSQDDDNTITFKIKLDSSKYEFIPSGEYLYDGQGAPCLDGGSMILNNVATTIGRQSVGLSKLVVNHNATTGESYFDAVAYVKAGSAVAKISNAGPFKLYETVEQGLEVVTESRNLMIWATWQSSQQAWELYFMGDAFCGSLYLATGTDSSACLPEGRYVFSQSAPADGGLWMDCSRSYVSRLRTSEELKIKCGESDSYLDVTTTLENGQYMHTIKGVLRTENGFYQINFDYGVERGSIY